MQLMGTAAASADPREASDGGDPEALVAAEELELAVILHALSDPMRLFIVAELAEEERTCSNFDLPIAKSTCTHHLRVLRESGLIRQRTVGTTRVNCLCRDEVDSQFPGLLDAVLASAGRLTAQTDR